MSDQMVDFFKYPFENAIKIQNENKAKPNNTQYIKIF
jgi:hypothetical protein